MTLSSLRVSCDPNTISMLTFTCCNVKYDVIKKNINMTMNGGQIRFYLRIYCRTLAVGKQTHDLTVTASDSKTTQSGGDNRKKFPLGAALQVPQNFSFAPL